MLVNLLRKGMLGHLDALLFGTQIGFVRHWRITIGYATVSLLRGGRDLSIEGNASAGVFITSPRRARSYGTNKYFRPKLLS